MMDHERWSTLKHAAERCTKCRLHQSRTHAVFGNGNPEAEIFLIGEGPGYEEDKRGEAFVGRSGQLLDKILAACNFTREKHVFISNIVKCRPPENRNPQPDEQAACLPYLEEQLELGDPKILVALGSVAAKALLGSEIRITKIRGNWHHYPGRLVMPTYHPSALLRQPSLKRDAWEDFKMVIDKYRELVDSQHECKNHPLKNFRS